MPLFIVGFFLSIIIFHHRGKWRSIACKRYMILSTIVILITLHPTLVKLVLKFFQCTDPINNSTYLIADVDVECGSSEHIGMLLGLALPALLFYILGILSFNFCFCFHILQLFMIGIPLIAGMMLYNKRNELNRSETREKIGFLYADYEPQYYLWFLVDILRLVSMATISVIFEGKYYYHTYILCHV